MMLEIIGLLAAASIISLVVIQIYINRLSADFLRVLTQLVRMNEVYGFDPVWLVKNMGPFLSRMMIRDYGYYLYYLNTEYEKKLDSHDGAFSKVIYTSDYTLYIELLPQRCRLNSRRLGRALTEVLFLMIKSDINISVKSAENAFKRSAEIQTFINHDVKNLIQFVNMLEFNLNTAETDDDNKKLVKYLKKSIPGLKNRADKVLTALNSTMPETDLRPEPVEILPLFLSAAANYGISADTDDGASLSVMSSRKVISMIFDNIVKNFYDKSLTEPNIRLKMYIRETDSSYMIVIEDSGSPLDDCEKIFEPFYTRKSGGLGIGLFHCRSIAATVGASLYAENTPDGPAFILEIKK